MLKAAAVREIIEILAAYEIKTKEDLLHHPKINEIEQQIRNVKGQRSGVSFHYIMMHVGDYNRFKPDRHIYTFFEKVLNYGKLNTKQLEEVFYRELNIVKTKFPYFTARAFDSAIWEFIKHDYKD